MKAKLERWFFGLLGPNGLLDLALRSGPHGSGFLPGAKGLNLGRLKKNPHGVDLGPLEPCLPGRLKTKNRRIDLAPEILVGDLGRLRRRLDKLESLPPMLLISRRQVRSNNSWMHNYQRLMRGKDRCTLWMHPDDAEGLGLGDAERVRVRSRVGEVEAPVELTDAIMPGVVCLPHGWGHGRPDTRLATANSRPGVSVNDLTDHARIDELSGNAALSGVPVTVEAA